MMKQPIIEIARNPNKPPTPGCSFELVMDAEIEHGKSSSLRAPYLNCRILNVGVFVPWWHGLVKIQGSGPNGFPKTWWSMAISNEWSMVVFHSDSMVIDVDWLIFKFPSHCFQCFFSGVLGEVKSLQRRALELVLLTLLLEGSTLRRSKSYGS